MNSTKLIFRADCVNCSEQAAWTVSAWTPPFSHVTDAFVIPCLGCLTCHRCRRCWTARSCQSYLESARRGSSLWSDARSSCTFSEDTRSQRWSLQEASHSAQIHKKHRCYKATILLAELSHCYIRSQNTLRQSSTFSSRAAKRHRVNQAPLWCWLEWCVEGWGQTLL